MKAVEDSTPKVENRPKPKYVKKSKKTDQDTPKVEAEPVKAVGDPTPKTESESKPNVEKQVQKTSDQVDEQAAKKQEEKSEQPSKPTPSPQQKAKVSDTRTSTAKTAKPATKKRSQTAKTVRTDEDKKYSNWWKSLEKQWQMAFNVALGNGEIIARPTNSQMKTLLKVKRLSFYRTSKNKLSFKLTNLTGIRELTELQTFNVAEHEISNLRGTDKLAKLHSLNCNKNQLKNLKGIDSLKSLKQFSCVGNELQLNNFTNIIQQLPNLKKLDVRNNRLSKEDKKTFQDVIKGIEVKL